LSFPFENSKGGIDLGGFCACTEQNIREKQKNKS